MYPVIGNLVFLTIIGKISLLPLPTELTPVNGPISGIGFIIGQNIQRSIHSIIRRVKEEGQTVAVTIPAGLNSMNWCLVKIVTPDLDDISNIDNHCPFHRLYREPFAVDADLQTTDFILDK